jgi:methionyl-tRNA formyltransferase
MKIVFFGSDHFAAVNLEALLSSPHQVVGCVTQPDKPQGRGMKMAVSPIKQISMEANIPIIQPLTLKDESAVAVLKVFDADMFVVVAYGRLLTQEILDIPKKFCVNVHGSLLPKYRGAAPVNWAILNGDKTTGVTIQKMVLTLDAGDILAQEQIHIPVKENAAQLRERMAHIGAKLLLRALDDIDQGKYALSPQDESKVTYAPKLNKEMGQT